MKALGSFVRCIELTLTIVIFEITMNPVENVIAEAEKTSFYSVEMGEHIYMELVETESERTTGIRCGCFVGLMVNFFCH